MIVALEDAVRGGVSGLMGLLNREGLWLAVIATSPNPTIAKAVEAIKQGALDYLPLPFDEGSLAHVLETVSVEAETMHWRHLRQAEARVQIGRLTPREREVVAAMARGLTNKEIGRALGISPRTVEIHRNNALTKLAARHSTEAVRLWFEAGDDMPAAA